MSIQKIAATHSEPRSENVARVLKSVWLCDGELSPAAFTMRPHIHETYISVLKETCNSFKEDIKTVTHGKFPVSYASMNVNELEQLKVDAVEDDVRFDVYTVDNDYLLSHAGIFIFINEQQLVGGEPFESLELQHGTSADSILLSIRETLADYAKDHIVQISEEQETKE